MTGYGGLLICRLILNLHGRSVVLILICIRQIIKIYNSLLSVISNPLRYIAAIIFFLMAILRAFLIILMAHTLFCAAALSVVATNSNMIDARNLSSCLRECQLRWRRIKK